MVLGWCGGCGGDGGDGAVSTVLCVGVGGGVWLVHVSKHKFIYLLSYNCKPYTV